MRIYTYYYIIYTRRWQQKNYTREQGTYFEKDLFFVFFGFFFLRLSLRKVQWLTPPTYRNRKKSRCDCNSDLPLQYSRIEGLMVGLHGQLNCANRLHKLKFVQTDCTCKWKSFQNFGLCEFRWCLKKTLRFK